MAIRKFRTGQMSYNAATYIGTHGTLFYDEDTGALRISDGVTPGGSLISYPVASSTQLGGIKLGPGVVLNSESQIIIDSEGLDFSFGDFAAIIGTYTDTSEYALLSSINADEDIVFASNGTGDIKVVGGFEVYATNGDVTGSLEDAEPFFRILDDGQVRILVPLADTTEGGLEIIGSELGTSLAPGQAGAMLHLTGNPDLPTRVYHDTLDEYSSYVFRRYNGSVITPTQVLANEDVGRINFTAANNAGMPGQALAQIGVTALENQTTTAQGSEIGFTVTPLGQPTANRVKVLKVDGVGVTTDRLVKARNYEGAVRNAGSVGGTTVTLDWSTDHMVHCTFTDNFTVAFSNYTAGRTITLIATNTSGGDTDVVTAGISAVNMQGDSTLTVSPQTTAIVTYYCTGTTLGSVYASAVYA